MARRRRGRDETSPDAVLTLQYLLECSRSVQNGQGWIGIDTESISDEPFGSSITLYGIDKKPVIRIARPLEPVVFRDGQVVSLEDFSGVSKRLIEKLEV